MIPLFAQRNFGIADLFVVIASLLIAQLLVGAVFLRAAFALFAKIQKFSEKPSQETTPIASSPPIAQTPSSNLPVIRTEPKPSTSRNREPDIIEAMFILFVCGAANTATYFGIASFSGNSRTFFGALASIVVSLITLAGMITYVCRVDIWKGSVIAALYVAISVLCVGGIVFIVALASGMFS